MSHAVNANLSGQQVFGWTSDEVWPPSFAGGSESALVFEATVVRVFPARLRKTSAMSGWMKKAKDSEVASEHLALAVQVDGGVEQVLSGASEFVAHLDEAGRRALTPEEGVLVVFGERTLEAKLRSLKETTEDPLAPQTVIKVTLLGHSLVVDAVKVLKAGPKREEKKREAVDVSGMFANYDPDAGSAIPKYTEDDGNDDVDEWSD